MEDTRDEIIKIRVSAAEKNLIIQNASAANLKPSSFLRLIGCGYEVKSKLDKNAILELAKINGDQGRLGGLLKMWLSNDERVIGDPRTLAKTIFENLELIKKNQEVMLDIVRNLHKF